MPGKNGLLGTTKKHTHPHPSRSLSLLPVSYPNDNKQGVLPFSTEFIHIDLVELTTLSSPTGSQLHLISPSTWSSPFPFTPFNSIQGPSRPPLLFRTPSTPLIHLSHSDLLGDGGRRDGGGSGSGLVTYIGRHYRKGPSGITLDTLNGKTSYLIDVSPIPFLIMFQNFIVRRVELLSLMEDPQRKTRVGLSELDIYDGSRLVVVRTRKSTFTNKREGSRTQSTFSKQSASGTSRTEIYGKWSKVEDTTIEPRQTLLFL